MCGLPVCKDMFVYCCCFSQASRVLFFLCGGFFVSLEEGLLDVAGDEFVSAEGHSECAAAANE